MIVWDFVVLECSQFQFLRSTGSFWLFTIQKLYSRKIFDHLTKLQPLKSPLDLRGFLGAQERGSASRDAVKSSQIGRLKSGLPLDVGCFSETIELRLKHWITRMGSEISISS